MFVMGILSHAMSSKSAKIHVDLDVVREMAEQGDANAQARLGWLYYAGKGVKRDYKKAEEWFRKAADQRNITGMLNLGVMYRKGQGVSKDPKEAVKWFREAAEQKDAEGQMFLGLMYMLGQGVAKNIVQAYMWLGLAASQGDKNAIKNCNLVAKIMTPAQIAQAQEMARNWKSAKQ